MTYTGQLVTGIAVLLAYLVIMLFAASNYIRRANRGWLEAHEAAFLGRVRAGIGARGPACVESASTDAALDAALQLLLPERAPEPATRRSHMFSPGQWIGFCEIARWVRLHEAQRLEIAMLSDSAVQARFARAMGQVDELPAVRQNAWQRRWVDLQNASAAPGRTDRGTAQMWRGELSQLLAELFNARDSTYNQLVSLYGKAGWLVIAAYLPVAALLVGGYGPVLLAGFLGGLISRMQRLVYGRGRPTAYGASWVPLFLAPLLGALAAWAGLHLLALLQGLGVVSLTGVLPPGSDFRMDPAASVLGIAVLLGFSERLFNQLGDHADKVLQGEQDGGSPAAAGSPASPFGSVAVPGPPPAPHRRDVTQQRHRRPRRVHQGARGVSGRSVAVARRPAQSGRSERASEALLGLGRPDPEPVALRVDEVGELDAAVVDQRHRHGRAELLRPLDRCPDVVHVDVEDRPVRPADGRRTPQAAPVLLDHAVLRGLRLRPDRPVEQLAVEGSRGLGVG
jgi:hypothetical protein